MGDLRSEEYNPAAGRRLEKSEVHIWRLDPEPDADLTRYLRILSSEERDRAARFRFPHLTHNFITDHGRLRLILGAYAQIDPEDLRFAVNEFGKPEIANGFVSLRFNLSHTQRLSLVAVCREAAIGIDVEACRPMPDLEEIAKSHFSRREIAALQETIEPDRQNAFFRCWTRKEAFIKAQGRGLSIPLDSFAVSLGPEAFPAILECAWDPEEPARWQLFSLPLDEGFMGALAITRGEWTITAFPWAGENRNLS
jgi:4'-phosphopantetheinyl transferase